MKKLKSLKKFQCELNDSNIIQGNKINGGQGGQTFSQCSTETCHQNCYDHQVDTYYDDGTESHVLKMSPIDCIT